MTTRTEKERECPIKKPQPVSKDAYESKEVIEVEGLHIPFISKDDLIKNKRSTGREKDKLDADYLSRNQDV